MAFHESTMLKAVEVDGRRDDIVDDNKEGEGTGECDGVHAPVHLASPGERCWDKFCRKDGEIQDGT